MTQKETIRNFYADGYDVNRICSIFMMSKAEVEAILDENIIVEKTGTTGKSKVEKPAVNHGIQNTPLFENEDGV